MKPKITLEWLCAAGARALKTIAQTALGMVTVGSALNDINWKYVSSVALMAGIYSILTSFATHLPEVGSDGVLQIDTSDPTKDTYLLALNNQLEDLGEKKKIILSVDTDADLSQKKPML